MRRNNHARVCSGVNQQLASSHVMLYSLATLQEIPVGDDLSGFLDEVPLP